MLIRSFDAHPGVLSRCATTPACRNWYRQLNSSRLLCSFAVHCPAWLSTVGARTFSPRSQSITACRPCAVAGPRRPCERPLHCKGRCRRALSAPKRQQEPALRRDPSVNGLLWLKARAIGPRSYYAARGRHHCKPRRKAWARSKNIEWSQMHKGPRVARGPGGRIKLKLKWEPRSIPRPRRGAGERPTATRIASPIRQYRAKRRGRDVTSA